MKKRVNLISDVVDKICYDFPDADKEFLKREISEKLPIIATRRRSIVLQITTLVYLLSKCPSNSDRPLSLKEIYLRYAMVEKPIQISTFFNAIKDAKSKGIQSCRLTPEIIITSKKGNLANFLNISEEEINEIIDRAVKIVKHEEVRKKLSGRNPYVTAATAVYLSCEGYRIIAQADVGYIFGVTTSSILTNMGWIKKLVSLGPSTILENTYIPNKKITIPVKTNHKFVERKPKRALRKSVLSKGHESASINYNGSFEDFINSNKKLFRVPIIEDDKIYIVRNYLKIKAPKNIHVFIKNKELYLERIDLGGISQSE